MVSNGKENSILVKSLTTSSWTGVDVVKCMVTMRTLALVLFDVENAQGNIVRSFAHHRSPDVLVR